MRTHGHGNGKWLVILSQTIGGDILTVAAGGQAINSKMQRMMEIVPEHIHDRSGIFMGSYDEVQKVIDLHKKYEK